MIGRRRFLRGGLAGLVGGLMAPSIVAAQQTGIVRLGDRHFVITTGVTNIVVRVAPGGLVIVDSGEPGRRDAVMAALRQLAPDGRVATVFNTHWHEEHTGANEILREGGARIVAHENTRLWMATPTWMPAEGRYRPPRPRLAHPPETFHAEGSMDAERERIDYGYLVAAHTSGDIYVRFRDANVLAAGDVASPVRDPALDWFTGAWLGGRVDAMDRLLSLCDADTRIVPGYGPVTRRQELQAERDMLALVYERVIDRVRQADTADDMLAGGVLAGLARRWDDPRTFIHAVHKGLWAHHDKLTADVV
jgi:cyclase